MKMRDLLEDVLFNAGEFCRIDIPIRLMAVEDYIRNGSINPLWWRMQYWKLAQWKGRNDYGPEEFAAKILNQKNRLRFTIRKVQDESSSPKFQAIELGKNSALIDGSHRLSCYMHFNLREVPVMIADRDGWRPRGLDPFIKELYTDGEWEFILHKKDSVVEHLRQGRWG